MTWYIYYIHSSTYHTISFFIFVQDQYIFIHDAVYEFLTCGDTQISSGNFRVAVDRLSREDSSEQCNGYEHQLRVLDQVSPNPSQVNCSTALKHPDKNRGDKYLPGDWENILGIRFEI